ncbi:hypothetical protein PISMIDRAFT_350625 [Pisolithus microcarpus 441]|uniref:Uncharacterized protein n=1 Tax=Pisolithus microcarpus 441 TaxID=765257 RepID=A0A0C9XQM5_9AGAM|nr:hypothetical protein BKA83DRAFT_350625 [Pisolithus microcarpus]KIK14530.1 hypothetical protein PISMIDRAFT_350625 [Pisolithus microcarpus 441]
MTHPNEGEKAEYSFKLPHVCLGTESGCSSGFYDLYNMNSPRAACRYSQRINRGVRTCTRSSG